MAINWNAYDAAKEIYGDNKDNIVDIGSRFPLFARTVSMVNSEYLLDILKALPKVTARVVESGLKDMGADETEAEEEVKEEVKDEPKKEAKKPAKGKKAVKKEEPEEDVNEEEDFDGDEVDYESMTGKALYALCCERGLSSKCKKRDKASLIAVLKAADGENTSADDDEDWDEEEEETDPYEGKKAKELYLMCKKRGIKCKTGMAADAYVKLLKKADAEEAETDDEEDDDDEWEV